MIADTLLSSKVALDVSFVTPSAGTSGVAPDEYKPCGLCQKIVIINDELAYLWAGRLNEVTEFDNNIRSLADQIAIGDINETAKLLNELLNPITSETCIVIFTRKKAEAVFQLAVRVCDTFDIPGFDYVAHGGYGGGIIATELMELHDRIPESMRIEEVGDVGSDAFLPTSLLESILQSHFTFEAYAHLSTGAIVEMATFYTNKIRKSDSTLFLLWDDELPFPFSIFPFLAIKRFYINEIMYVSFHNYLSKNYKHFSIGHPGNLNPGPPEDLRDYIPLYGKIENVHTIRYRKTGITTHRAESAKIVQEHFAFCPILGCIIFSDWYSKDVAACRARSNRTEYPY